MAHCPYCKEDLGGLARELMDEVKASKACVLCPPCGEPIMFEDSEFRKPTSEEFEHIVDSDNYHRSRAAWLEMQKLRVSGGNFPIEDQWRKFIANAPKEMRNGPMEDMARALFFAAYNSAYSFFSSLSDMEPEEFVGMRALIEAELAAFREEAMARVQGSSNKLN